MYVPGSSGRVGEVSQNTMIVTLAEIYFFECQCTLTFLADTFTNQSWVSSYFPAICIASVCKSAGAVFATEEE